jgi:hypothetical protein
MEDQVGCDADTYMSQMEDNTRRSCRGELYHPEFFTKDSESQMYSRRHAILFNLYNFDGLESWNPSLFASLTMTNCTFEYLLSGYESLIYIETNNMEQVTQKGVSMVYMLGHDKGVSITIDKS